MSKYILILDYRVSNLFSISNAITSIGCDVKVSSEKKDLKNASAIILPGVGSFPKAMGNIIDLNLDEEIKKFAKSGKQVFGICLGMQLLFDKSYEFGETDGLALISGDILPLASLKSDICSPHIGWNSVKSVDQNINKKNEDFYKNPYYFVHSFYAEPKDKEDIFSNTNYDGISFCSSIRKDNIFATQFHPEKSGKFGINILRKYFAAFIN